MNDSLKGLLRYYGTMLICGVLLGYALYTKNRLDEYISKVSELNNNTKQLLIDVEELKYNTKELEYECGILYERRA